MAVVHRALGARPLDLIGSTPLVRLGAVTSGLLPGVTLLAKAEQLNPGGSVKDRPALAMILDGLARGVLTPDKVILDATSGNTGIAYATIAAAWGYRVELCMPANASIERKRALVALGVELVLTDAAAGADGAIDEARRRYAREPGRYFYPDQYNNDANWKAHYDTTGVEIWEQTQGEVTHFVTGLGTGGTFTGVGRRLREYRSTIRLIAVQPDGPFHGLEGLKHYQTALVPGIYDQTLADSIVTVETEEAYAMARRLAREAGLMVGISSGANVAAALRVASTLSKGVVVTVLCDGAAKYLSESFWTEELA